MAEQSIHYFLGANTPDGFYSLYDQLLDIADTETFFILKGTPGCGKSTLMRRAGAALAAQGVRVEYIRCSGDPDSLDAVVFPELHAAVADGTAPHVIEPLCPGAVDHYVNLEAALDADDLRPFRAELLALRAQSRAAYARAYRCLSGAVALLQEGRSLLLTPAVEEHMARRVKGILSREVHRTGTAPGHTVRRFLGAVTAQGEICDFSAVEVLCSRVYELCDSYSLASPMLRALAEGAAAAGHDVILCPSPLEPERPEHLLIPDLSLAFVSSTPARPWPHRPYRRIRLDAMADAETLRRCRSRLRFARKVGSELMEEAAAALADAKAAHDAQEAIYRPHVDFTRVEAEGDAVIRALTELSALS